MGDSLVKGRQDEKGNQQQGGEFGRQGQAQGDAGQYNVAPTPSPGPLAAGLGGWVRYLASPNPPQGVEGEENKKGHPQIGGHQARVGQDVGIADEEKQGHEARYLSRQLTGPAVEQGSQQQAQSYHRQAGEEDNTLYLVSIGLPEELVGEDVPGPILPRGVFQRQFQLGTKEQRQGAQGVDQRGMFHTQAQVAGEQVCRPTGDVILLVHRGRLEAGTAQSQSEHCEQQGNGDAVDYALAIHNFLLASVPPGRGPLSLNATRRFLAGRAANGRPAPVHPNEFAAWDHPVGRTNLSPGNKSLLGGGSAGAIGR